MMNESRQFGFVHLAPILVAALTTSTTVLAIAFVCVVLQLWETWYFKSRALMIAEARLAAELNDKGGDDDE